MTPETTRVTLDLADASSSALPDPPDAGIVVVEVPEMEREVCGSRILDLAGQWAAAGHRVFVCDACFETPLLHLAAGIPNAEGLSDAILYGTSLRRIGRRLASGAHLATAGTLVTDPDTVRGHRRWSAVIPGFVEAGALLVVAVPSGCSGAFTEAVGLEIGFSTGAPREPDLDVERGGGQVPESDPVILPVEPVDPGEPSAEVMENARIEQEREGNDPDFDSGSEALLSASPEGAPPAGPPAGAPPSTSGPDAPPAGPAEIELPSVREKPSPRRSARAGRVALLLFLVAVIAVLAAGYAGWIEIPGITRPETDAVSGTFESVVGVGHSHA